MKKSLRTRLTVYFIALALIPMLLVGAFVTWQTYTAQASQALEAQSQVAKRVAEQVKAFMSLRENEISLLTEVDNIATASPEEQAALLDSLLASQNAYEELALTNSRGMEVIRISRTQIIGREDLKNRANSSEFEQPKESGNTYYSSISLDEVTGEPYIVISAPLFDLRTGNLSNVLIARVHFKPIWDIMAKADVIGSGVVYMVDENNFVVAHAVPSVALQKKQATLPEKNSFAAGIGGNTAAMAIEPIQFNNRTFYIVAEQPAVEALSLALSNILLTLGFTLAAVVTASFLGVLAARQITTPIGELAHAAALISEGDLSQNVQTQSEDEIGRLAGAFNKMTRQLRDLIHTLEERIAERTRNLKLAAEVGRSVSQVRALDIMLTNAAELILEQFGLYYAQIYLVNPGKTHLILQAGTGDVGKELLSRSHSLPFDTASINGRAVVEKRSVVIADALSSPTFRPNPLLPNTQSEISAPLLVGDNVIGALDLQSDKAGALSRDLLPAVETLAGQLAIAIQNARLLAETERARAEVEAQARRLTRANWSEYLDAIHMPEKTGFIFEGGKVTPQPEAQPPSKDALVAPIVVSGETLGSLVVDTEGEPLAAQARELLDTISSQVAQQIENLRLLESAERYRAEAEEASRRITREGWREYLQNAKQTSMQYYYDTQKVTPEPPKQLENAEVVPIEIRGEKLGSLAVPGMEELSEQDRELMESTAQRLGEHLESLRLTEQTRERAMREQALRQIASAVRASTYPETILRTAARELGELLGRRVMIQTDPAAKQASES